MDKWIKCISIGGTMVATAITAPDLIEDARKRHKLSSAETKGLGEALMASLLLASTCKAGERVSLSIKGDKFFRQAIADATPEGKVRGFVIAKELESDIDTSMGPWQNGLLSVVRLKLNEKEPYVGTVPIVTGYLAKDLTFYLTQSEQIPSAVGLAVNLGKNRSVVSAGAFLVQVLPGASKKEIESLENNINQLEGLAARLAKDSDPTRLLAQIFSDAAFTILDERPLAFECTCSRDRVSGALKLLGKAEIEDMIAKDHGADVNCDFCGTCYSYSEGELAALLQATSSTAKR
ncbi:MAG: Hsp33 family molecular chaperone HslO [Deltaproteobacteria bacterium]|nr:Hsp33 family molecular chaperone HslO [Deltaproteobacteria bacterium]